MMRCMEMCAGMPVRRRIAAADMSALEAHAEMHPFSAGLKALFAAFGVGFDFLDLVEVGTCGSHTA